MAPKNLTANKKMAFKTVYGNTLILLALKSLKLLLNQVKKMEKPGIGMPTEKPKKKVIYALVKNVVYGVFIAIAGT